MYNPTWISKKLKIQREFTKDVLKCLEIGENPENRIINKNETISDSNKLLIESYFKTERNIGKSIKSLKSYINNDKKSKIPVSGIRKVLRKVGVHYIKRKIQKKKIKKHHTPLRLKKHSYRLLDLFQSNTNIIFIDTVSFWSKDYNSKIWAKTNSILHQKAETTKQKKFLFDMIVASELNLGIIAAQCFDGHHKGQDWAYFINKLIEQCNILFNDKKVILFLDNAPVQRTGIVDKFIGARATFFYNQVNFYAIKIIGKDASV